MQKVSFDVNPMEMMDLTVKVSNYLKKLTGAMPELSAHEVIALRIKICEVVYYAHKEAGEKSGVVMTEDHHKRRAN